MIEHLPPSNRTIDADIAPDGTVTVRLNGVEVLATREPVYGKITWSRALTEVERAYLKRETFDKITWTKPGGNRATRRRAKHRAKKLTGRRR